MWDKIKNTIVIALATLGVLFIILMLLPDSGDDAVTETAGTVKEETASEETAQEETVPEETAAEESSGIEDVTEETVAEEPDPAEASGKETEESKKDEAEEKEEDKKNTVTVNIPESEITDYSLRFRTDSLDNKTVTDAVFADYDITVVYVWGTYCVNCINEMGDYAAFNDELPDNINLIGIVSDIYDGIDNNVEDAKDILKDAGAEFTNLRTSDSIFDLTASVRYVPTAFFVDKEGHIIGGLLQGARYKEVRKALEAYIE